MATLRSLTSFILTGFNGNQIELTSTEAEALLADLTKALGTKAATTEERHNAELDTKVDQLVDILYDRLEKQPRIIDAIKLTRDLGNMVKVMVGLKEAKDFVEHMMYYTGVKYTGSVVEMPTDNEEFFKRLKELVLDRRCHNNTRKLFFELGN